MRIQRLRVPKRTRGFTLVDTVSVALLSGMLLSFASLILALAFRANSKAVEHLGLAKSLQDAHSRFVKDSHNSVSATTGESLELAQANGSIVTYRIDEDQFVREIRAKNQLLSSQGWKLPGKATISWTEESDSAIDRLKCTIEFAGSRPDMPIRWVSRLGVFGQNPVDATKAIGTPAESDANASNGAEAASDSEETRDQELEQ